MPGNTNTQGHSVKENKPSTSTAQVACKPKPRSVVMSSIAMPPYSGPWVAIGPAVMLFARAAQAFSAGIKCWHCRKQICHSHLTRSFLLRKDPPQSKTCDSSLTVKSILI